MKLTDVDIARLYTVAFPAVIALRLTKTPPNKDGEAKSLSIDFVAAVWTKRYVETLRKVIEDDSRGSGRQSEGFPS